MVTLQSVKMLYNVIGVYTHVYDPGESTQIIRNNNCPLLMTINLRLSPQWISNLAKREYVIAMSLW